MRFHRFPCNMNEAHWRHLVTCRLLSNTASSTLHEWRIHFPSVPFTSIVSASLRGSFPDSIWSPASRFRRLSRTGSATFGSHPPFSFSVQLFLAGGTWTGGTVYPSTTTVDYDEHDAIAWHDLVERLEPSETRRKFAGLIRPSGSFRGHGRRTWNRHISRWAEVVLLEFLLGIERGIQCVHSLDTLCKSYEGSKFSW